MSRTRHVAFDAPHLANPELVPPRAAMRGPPPELPMCDACRQQRAPFGMGDGRNLCFACWRAEGERRTREEAHG